MNNNSIKNPLKIGKTLASFTVDKTKESQEHPTIFMDLQAVEAKAKRISEVLGTELTAEQVALFTFIHEMKHYDQWKEGKITTEELRTGSFRGTPKAAELEIEADAAAVEFVKKTIGYGKKWNKRTLQAMVGAEDTLTLDQAKELGIIS